jgi:hypothetical protein
VLRSALVALCALAAATTARPAHADDVDPNVWPHRATVVSLGGGAQYLRNESIGGPALFVEHGLGRGRWQWVPNVTAQWFIGDAEHRGWGAQLGLDARWLARNFEPDSSASLQLFINGGPGVEHVELGNGMITRPNVGVGWGFQIRALHEPHRWMFRFAFRFELAPALDTRDVDRIICRGQCTSAASSLPLDEGFKALLGLSW